MKTRKFFTKQAQLFFNMLRYKNIPTLKTNKKNNMVLLGISWKDKN